MFNIIIFSKNRAFQLDLCIRSLKEQFKSPCTIYVQYTYSNNDYKKGFDILKERYPDITFIKEDKFKDTFVKIINGFTNKYFFTLTDDDVFINTITQDDMNKHLAIYESNPKIHTLSMRMNPTINFCHPANKKIDPPSRFIHDKEYLLWDWRLCERAYCWGYPMAINTHIYRIKEMLPLFKRLNYHNVNSLESAINKNRFNKPYILSFKESKVFNVQNNFVQGKRLNETHFNYDIKNMNDMLLADKQITTKGIYGLKRRKAHGDLEYIIK